MTPPEAVEREMRFVEEVVGTELRAQHAASQRVWTAARAWLSERPAYEPVAFMSHCAARIRLDGTGRVEPIGAVTLTIRYLDIRS